MARVQLMFTSRDNYDALKVHDMFQDVGLALLGNKRGDACLKVCRAIRDAAEELNLKMTFVVCEDGDKATNEDHGCDPTGNKTPTF